MTSASGFRNTPPSDAMALAPSPLPALLLGIAAGALLGARRDRSPRVRAALTVGGLALFGAAAHRPVLQALVRAGTRRRSASVRLSLVIPHPVEAVFAFVRDFENFPRVIGALREVRDYGDGRSHWCASTPTGGTLEWDTVTTKYVPNRVIAWQSVPGAPVEMTGSARFVPEGAETCVTFLLEYRVLEGGIADALAALATPRRDEELERDIRGLSSYLDVVRSSPDAPPLES